MPLPSSASCIFLDGYGLAGIGCGCNGTTHFTPYARATFELTTEKGLSLMLLGVFGDEFTSVDDVRSCACAFRATLSFEPERLWRGVGPGRLDTLSVPRIVRECCNVLA